MLNNSLAVVYKDVGIYMRRQKTASRSTTRRKRMKPDADMNDMEPIKKKQRTQVSHSPAESPKNEDDMQIDGSVSTAANLVDESIQHNRHDEATRVEEWDGTICLPESPSIRSEFDSVYFERSGLKSIIHSALRSFDVHIEITQQKIKDFETAHRSAQYDLRHLSYEDNIEVLLTRASYYKEAIEIALEHFSDVFVQKEALRDEVDEGPVWKLEGILEKARVDFRKCEKGYGQRLYVLLKNLDR